MLACSDAQLPAELAGLAINLATASRAADALAAEGGMRHLLERLLQTHDLVLLKLIRALVAHDGPASAAAPLTAELLGLTRQVVDDEHMRLELLGTLSGLRLARLPDLPRLVERYSLIELLRQHMAPGAAQDDTLLEAVVLERQAIAVVRKAPALDLGHEGLMILPNHECATGKLAHGLLPWLGSGFGFGSGGSGASLDSGC